MLLEASTGSKNMRDGFCFFIFGNFFRDLSFCVSLGWVRNLEQAQWFTSCEVRTLVASSFTQNQLERD